MARFVPVGLALLLSLGVMVGRVNAESAVRVVYHGSRDAPIVALTFDDGYNAERCGRIVDILERRGVPATFFPYARAVASAPNFWRRVAALGYPIGNHTTTHPDMTKLTLEEATDEIARARTIVERITGRRMIRVLRPPYGAWDRTVVEAARSAGFPTLLLWDADDVDWSRSKSRSAVLKAALRGRNGSVVLMHCGPSVTPRILDQVIDGYVERGFAFVTVPQLLRGYVPATVFSDRDPLPARHGERALESLGMSLMSAVWAHGETRWAM